MSRDGLMRAWMSLTAVAAVVVACGSGDPEPGVSCKADSECGDLKCLCVRDPVPGTCSASCQSDADCARFGGDYTCRDFCTKTLRICLRG